MDCVVLRDLRTSSYAPPPGELLRPLEQYEAALGGGW